MKKIIRSILLLAFFTFQPIVLLNASASSDVVIGKFSPGGRKLYITVTPQTIIFGLGITYCDGTTSRFSPSPYIIQREFIFFSDWPMQRVVIYTTTSDETIATFPFRETIVKRGCTRRASIPLSPPYCNDVQISREIHRSQAEQISFRSNRFVYKAGLKLPGVDGIVWVRTLEYNYGLRSKLNLEFDYTEKRWTGKFPSMYIPIGKYSNVWLVVEDEFGQKAKCRVGELDIQY